jgi:molybdopterin/thiamine biosynthesis adenylyltransferase
MLAELEEGREIWTYDEAFQRNRGLVALGEQGRLRRATVAIAGLGGVGGSHALTLARMGVGGFHLADPDHFAVANFNRQACARISSLGENKAIEAARAVRDINPEVRVHVVPAAITPENVDRFLTGVDVVLDGLDFFAMEARRLLYGRARARGLWVLSAAPLGFSAALLAFSPDGMSFDDYFDLRRELSPEEQLISFAVGLAPSATHLPYMDLSAVDLGSGAGPSSSIGCILASAVIATGAIAVLLGRGHLAAAPAYCQVDPYRGLLRRGVLRFGNRGPLQRLKRWLLGRHLRRLGVLGRGQAQPALPAPRGASRSAGN